MFYDITYTAYMKSDLLSMTSHPLFRTSHHFTYDIKSTVSDLTSTISVSSHPPYRWHHSHYMEGITSSISMTSYPLCFWQNIHKVWHHNTLCWFHHTRHMFDILCTADDIAYTLSHQTRIFVIKHPLQAWHHTTCIRHCTNCIFLITTSPLIKHPLWNDITATFCVTSYALYRTSHPILMSSQYCTYDIITSIYETTYSMKGNIYTKHETSQPLSVSSHPPYRQHHTHSLYDITLAIYVASFALYKTSHPHFMTSKHRV